MSPADASGTYRHFHEQLAELTQHLLDMSDKATALKTAERLTQLLIQENTLMRGNLAEATNEFLGTQLADARKRLEAQEQKLQNFRQLHAGRLPSQVQANMQAVQTTQMALNSAQESLARDRDRKLMLERLYRDARAGSLQPATSDVCADWLGTDALGGDPDSDGVAPRW